jgi:hypothetical protein
VANCPASRTTFPMYRGIRVSLCIHSRDAFLNWQVNRTWKKKQTKKKYIIDNVSDIKVCTFVSNKNSWNPLSLSLVPPPLFRGYFVIVNFLLKTKLKKTNRNYVEVAVNALNFVIIKFLPLNVTRLNPFIFFFVLFVLNIFSPRPLFFSHLFCFFFLIVFFLFHYYFQTLAVT